MKHQLSEKEFTREGAILGFISYTVVTIIILFIII